MNCFGNIFQKNRRLMARMEGINKKLIMGTNIYILKLLNKLWKEYFLCYLKKNYFGGIKLDVIGFGLVIGTRNFFIRRLSSSRRT